MLAITGAGAITSFAWALESKYHANGNRAASIPSAAVMGLCGGIVGVGGVLVNIPDEIFKSLSPLTASLFCPKIGDEVMSRIQNGYTPTH